MGKGASDVNVQKDGTMVKIKACSQALFAARHGILRQGHLFLGPRGKRSGEPAARARARARRASRRRPFILGALGETR